MEGCVGGVARHATHGPRWWLHLLHAVDERRPCEVMRADDGVHLTDGRAAVVAHGDRWPQKEYWAAQS
jgi:hypothetical protein